MACSSRRRSWPRRWATEADARLGEAPGEQPLPASRLLKSASAAVELFGWGPPLQGKSFASGGGRRCKGKSFASGGGRRCKGFASAAWFRVLLQHAGAVHPCTARTKSPCSDVLRDRGVRRFGGHCLRAAGTGIDEATDIQVAKDAVVRGLGASRPWMACARLLEPGMAQPGDAHDPRTAAAPPDAYGLRRFSDWPDPASITGEEPKKKATSPGGFFHRADGSGTPAPEPGQPKAAA